MFTGIIECIGSVIRTEKRGSSIRLLIEPQQSEYDVEIGGSVAVDGCCLTLEQLQGNTMEFSAVAETLKKTTLYGIGTGQKVNLERASVIGDRLDGHLVYGHVDGTGTILRDREINGSTLRTVAIPEELSVFLAKKGSVAMDGISLTIAESTRNDITLSLIPHTLQMTTLTRKRPGDSVNIECDIVARYLQRLISTPRSVPASSPRRESLQSIMERAGF
jgi:riboflavin synthase